MTTEEVKDNATKLTLWIPSDLIKNASDNVLLEYIKDAAMAAVKNRPDTE